MFVAVTLLRKLTETYRALRAVLGASEALKMPSSGGLPLIASKH